MTAPRFNILTQKELVIDLSRPAMEWILRETGRRLTVPVPPDDSVECEVDNFRNMLQNLLERSEGVGYHGVESIPEPGGERPPPESGNFDLIGG